MRLLLAPAGLLLAAGVWAQEPPPGNPPQPQPQRIDAQDTPAPQEEQQSSEYGGPTILSRGGSATVGRDSANFELRPYVSASGIYDSGLGTVSVDQSGQVHTVDSFGAEVRLGVTGSRAWKKTEIDLDYRGSLRHYTRQSFYDGMDHSLLLTVRNRATKHVTIELEEVASRYESSFFMPNNVGTLYNPLTAGLGGNELFNTPTTVLMSTLRVIYQRTARLSLSASGTGFLVRRQSAALAGATGYTAVGDLAYRISRNQTIGLDYSNTRFDFTRQFGSSDMHGVAFNYAARIGKRWEFTLRAGGFRVAVRRLVQVQLDPAIAAIFGEATGIEVFDRVVYMPHYEAHLTRAMHRGLWSAGYIKTMMPGNGVYLTSSSDGANMSYSYNGFRNLSLQSSLDYHRLSSLSQTIGRFQSYGAGIGANVKLSRAISMIARIDGRHYSAGGSALQRTSYRATLGLAWNPGEYPVAIW